MSSEGSPREAGSEQHQQLAAPPVEPPEIGGPHGGGGGGTPTGAGSGEATADGPGTPGSQQQQQGGSLGQLGAAALEGQIAKFKRLLAMSRQRLEENQKQLADKNQMIERLTAELEAQRAASARLMAAASSSNSGSGSGGGRGGPSPVPALPRRALLRVHEGSTVWVLFEFDDGEGPTEQPGGSMDGCWWRPFRSEDDLQAFLRRVPGEPLQVPPPSLTPQASDEIREEARVSVSRLSEEFRKYRVRAELSLRQKEAEIKQVSWSSMSAQQHRIEERVDAEDLARQVRAQDDRIAQLRQELQEQESRWRGMYEKLVKENEMLQGAGAETALAAQWRKRYESVLREKEDLASKLDLNSSSSSTEGLLLPVHAHAGPPMAASTAEQKYLDVKEEYKLYRKKALEALREKDALIAEQAVMLQQQGVHQPPPSSAAQAGGGLRRGSGPAGVSVGVRSGTPTPGGMGGLLDVEGDPRMQYLKNLVMRYLSTDSNEIREPTERAICTVLRFSEDELKKMQAGRASSASAGGAALVSSMAAQWALPTNLFGSSSSSSS